MDNTDLLLLILFGGVFALLMIAWLGKYLADYFADIKYVKTEARRAYDWKEYVYWRRELSALRWSIIPGLTPHIVKAIKRFFYRGKHAEKEEKSDGFTSMLMPSVLGICICAVCLAGSTFAWFTASQSTATQTIQAANYNVTTVVTISNETPISEQNGVYHLEKDTTYEVTLTAKGDATTGYCILDFGGSKAYTDQIAKGTSITINLKMNESATLEITAVWGTYAGDGKISTEYTYGTATIADEDAPNENNNDVHDVTEPTEEGTEPSKTEDNNVPTTESEVTAPPETENDTDTSEIKAEE